MWKSIGILGAKVGFKITNYSKGNGQGIGSISLIGELIQPEIGSPSNILIALRSDIFELARQLFGASESDQVLLNFWRSMEINLPEICNTLC